MIGKKVKFSQEISDSLSLMRRGSKDDSDRGLAFQLWPI